MARLKTYKMYDVLSREYQKKIADYNQRLVDAANKRLKRLEQAGLISPAYRMAKEWGGFSGRGLRQADNWNELIKQHARVVAFLNNPTSSVTGAREYEKDIKNLMGNRDLSEQQKEMVFDVFRRLEETNALKANLYYRDLFDYIAKTIDEDKSAIADTADKKSREYQDFIDENLKRAHDELERIVDKLERDISDFAKKFNRIK